MQARSLSKLNKNDNTQTKQFAHTNLLEEN